MNFQMEGGLYIWTKVFLVNFHEKFFQLRILKACSFFCIAFLECKCECFLCLFKQLEVGEGVVDRKPSITITLSSDGEADDDEEAVVIGENSNQWLKKQEAEVGEVEQEVEELLEVAKEDITAKLELQVGENKVEEEGNVIEDTDNKIEEGEGVKRGNSDGAKASLDMLGKLATTLSSSENSEDPVEAQQTENNEKTADLIEEKKEKEYEEEGTVKASSEDMAQVVDQDLDK